PGAGPPVRGGAGGGGRRCVGPGDGVTAGGGVGELRSHGRDALELRGAVQAAAHHHQLDPGRRCQQAGDLAADLPGRAGDDDPRHTSPFSVSQPFAMSALLVWSTTLWRFSSTRSSALSSAMTPSITATAVSSSDEAATGTTFCGRIIDSGSS